MRNHILGSIVWATATAASTSCAEAAWVVSGQAAGLRPAGGTASSDKTGKQIRTIKIKGLRRSTRPAGTASQQRMIELLIIACNEAECRRFALLYDPFEMSLMNCILLAQREAARWAAANPGWTVGKMSCRYGGSPDFDI
jgi:hypothetical protein